MIHSFNRHTSSNEPCTSSTPPIGRCELYSIPFDSPCMELIHLMTSPFSRAVHSRLSSRRQFSLRKVSTRLASSSRCVLADGANGSMQRFFACLGSGCSQSLITWQARHGMSVRCASTQFRGSLRWQDAQLHTPTHFITC